MDGRAKPLIFTDEDGETRRIPTRAMAVILLGVCYGTAKRMIDKAIENGIAVSDKDGKRWFIDEEIEW